MLVTEHHGAVPYSLSKQFFSLFIARHAHEGSADADDADYGVEVFVAIDIAIAFQDLAQIRLRLGILAPGSENLGHAGHWP